MPVSMLSVCVYPCVNVLCVCLCCVCGFPHQLEKGERRKFQQVNLFSPPSFLCLAQRDGDGRERISVSKASRLELITSLRKSGRDLSVCLQGLHFYDLGSLLQPGFF